MKWVEFTSLLGSVIWAMHPAGAVEDIDGRLQLCSLDALLFIRKIIMCYC